MQESHEHSWDKNVNYCKSSSLNSPNQQVFHVLDQWTTVNGQTFKIGLFKLRNVLIQLTSFLIRPKKILYIIQTLLDILYLCFCKLLVLNQNNHNGLTKSGCVVRIMSVKSFVAFLCFWNNGRSGSFTRTSWLYWFADVACRPPALALSWTAAGWGWGLLWQTDQLTHLPGSRAWISLLNLTHSQFNQAVFHCSWLHC